MIKLINHIYERFSHFLNTHENGVIGRQRLAVLVYTSLIIILGIPLNLIGLTGPEGKYYFIQNIFHLLLCFIGYFLYFTHRINLTTTLSFTFIVSQLAVSAEMIYCAYNPTFYHLMLIVGNLLISIAIVFFTFTAYMTVIPYIVSSIAIGTYIFCAYTTGDPNLLNFTGIFIIIFIATCLLGYNISNKSLLLQKENLLLKSHEDHLLDFFNMSKEQFDAYIELSTQKQLSLERRKMLLEAMGEKTKLNLFNVVSDQLIQDRTDERIIAEVFSELTPSERQICRLILQHKSIGEICELLGKSQGNITSQRTHIRQKLGLKPNENLKERLIELMEQRGHSV